MLMQMMIVWVATAIVAVAVVVRRRRRALEQRFPPQFIELQKHVDLSLQIVGEMWAVL